MFRKLRIQGRMQIFEKMSQKALNRVLRLDCSGGGDFLQSPQKNMDLQNKNIFSIFFDICEISNLKTFKTLLN